MESMKIKAKCLPDGYLYSRPTEDKAPKNDSEGKKVALNRCYLDEKGLYVPNMQIRAAILGGIDLQNMKINKSKFNAIKLAQSTLRVSPDKLYCHNGKQMKEADLEYFKKPTKIDAGKGKTKMIWTWHAKTRPGFTIEFEVFYINDILSTGFIEDAVRGGLLLAGIGGLRPYGYGKFEVI